MSTRCDVEDCVLRLERISASAKLLAKQLQRRDWHSNVLAGARQIAADALTVREAVEKDQQWAASDR